MLEYELLANHGLSETLNRIYQALLESVIFVLVLFFDQRWENTKEYVLIPAITIMIDFMFAGSMRMCITRRVNDTPAEQ